MLKIFLIFCFMVQICYAKNDNSRAINHVQKALYTYPVVKAYAKSAEQEVMSYLPFSKQYAAWIGSMAMTAVSGQINTRKIKKLNLNVVGGNMRPDVVYDFRTGATSGLVFITWNWE